MSNKFKQFVAFGVCSVVALAVCLGVLVITVNNSDSDVNVTANEAVVNKTELDSSTKTLVKYINKLVDGTQERFVKTKSYTDISVNDLVVLDDDQKQENDTALLNYTKDRILSSIDGYYAEDEEGSFEKDDSRKISLVLNKNTLKNAAFSIGQVDENGKSVFDDEGNLIDNEYYYLNFDIDTENKSFDEKVFEMFSVKNDISAKEQFIEALKDECIVNDFQADTDSFIIKAKINRCNDEIQYINVIRNYKVTLDATFINKAEIFGEKTISFVYTVIDTYEYSYAGISFVEDEVTIEHDEEYMLNVNAVIDDDSEYTVEFLSSDDARVSVDEMGYIKGLKNCDVPVTITVKLNYLGETFTDTCTVYVSVKEGL